MSQRWDPGAVRAVGDAARTRAQTSIDTANEPADVSRLDGPGSEEAKQAIEETRQGVDEGRRRGAGGGALGRRGGGQRPGRQGQSATGAEHGPDCGMVVDPVSGAVRPVPGSMATANDWHNAKVLQQAIQRVLAQANKVDQQLAAAMDRADGVVDVPPEARPIPLPPPGATAEDVNQWWKSLSQKDRERLIAEHPAELGNLNGIPAAARDTINQQVQTDDLNRISDTAAQHGVSKEQVLANPGFYGLSADDVTRYNNAIKVQQGMNHQRGDDPDPSRSGRSCCGSTNRSPTAGRAAPPSRSATRTTPTTRRSSCPGTSSSVKRRLAQRRPQRRHEPLGPGQRGRPEQHPLGDLVDGLRRAG